MGEKLMKRLFDREAFARSIRVRLAERGISLLEGAREAGVSHSSLCRVANLGRTPDVENYLRITHWLRSEETALPSEAER